MEEKIRVHITGFLNFEKITELPLTASSTSRFPEPCLRPEPYAGAATWPPHASHLRPKPLLRPLFPWNHSSLAPLPHATRPACSCARHGDGHCRAPEPGIPQAAASQFDLPQESQTFATKHTPL